LGKDSGRLDPPAHALSDELKDDNSANPKRVAPIQEGTNETSQFGYIDTCDFSNGNVGTDVSPVNRHAKRTPFSG